MTFTLFRHVLRVRVSYGIVIIISSLLDDSSDGFVAVLVQDDSKIKTRCLKYL
jgi:hypothetical protein